MIYNMFARKMVLKMEYNWVKRCWNCPDTLRKRICNNLRREWVNKLPKLGIILRRKYFEPFNAVYVHFLAKSWYTRDSIFGRTFQNVLGNKS